MFGGNLFLRPFLGSCRAPEQIGWAINSLRCKLLLKYQEPSTTTYEKIHHHLHRLHGGRRLPQFLQHRNRLDHEQLAGNEHQKRRWYCHDQEVILHKKELKDRVRHPRDRYFLLAVSVAFAYSVRVVRLSF